MPWMFKYVNAKHAGVATEWQMSVVISVRAGTGKCCWL